MDPTIHPELQQELAARDAQLEALREVGGKLAHDFNNYLAPVLGYIALLEEELPLHSSVRSYLASMEKGARHTERSLEAMLLALRPRRRFHPVEVDLKGLVEERVAHWEAGIGDSVPIRIHKDLKPAILLADRTHWKGVLDQLLANARFALAMGGDLWVALAPAELSPEEESAYGCRGREIFRFEMRDNGVGMSPDVLRRAIEPFFTTHPKGEAEGLGLTLAHSVVKSLHDGQLLLSSREDEGTTVTLLIPRSSKGITPAGAARTIASSRNAAESVGRRALLVDDDPLVREVMKIYLQRLRFEVIAAKDGAEGLRIIKRSPKGIALVVSDITMPEMDGIELCKEIWGLELDLPVLLITGNAAAMSEQSLARLGGVRPPMLQKPITLQAFAEAVSQLVAAPADEK